MELTFFDMLEVFTERFRTLKSTVDIVREHSEFDKLTTYKVQKVRQIFQRADEAWNELSQKAKKLSVSSSDFK